MGEKSQTQGRDIRVETVQHVDKFRREREEEEKNKLYVLFESKGNFGSSASSLPLMLALTLSEIKQTNLQIYFVKFKR